MRLLRLHFLAEDFFLFFAFFFDALRRFCRLRIADNDLACRIDTHRFQIFNRALALGVKAADGVDLISPQLDADGIFFCQRKNIHNAAADSKLPRRIHLRRLFVAHLDELS